MKQSYFDGDLLSYIGYCLLGFFVTVITLGLATPWAICLMYDWRIKHTVIDGRRCYFDGTAMQLFGNWIKWLFLTFVTLGIYGFWVHIKLQQWITEHTHFVN